MEPNDLKCKNCGADLELESANTLKCHYCGSTFPIVLKDPAPITTPQQPDKPADNSFAQQAERHERQNGSTKAGALAIVIFIFIAVVVYFIVASQSADSGSTSSKLADSMTIDTSGRTALSDTPTTKKATEEYNPNSPFLLTLEPIKVDSATFKKLYRNTRKKHDKFSGSTFIFDKTSPQYVNYNGLYAYIGDEHDQATLRFSVQYAAQEWLFIERMIFNADGNNFNYSPTFKRDNGEGGIWEWSDEEIDDGNDLDMLVKIALAKTAQVKYEGDKYYKVVNITHAQQTALKKQLQIFKGLLLHYAK